MCAIAGIVTLDGRPLKPGVLHRMNRQLRHRGCDDEGYVLIEPDSGACAKYSGDDSPRPLQGTYPMLRHSQGHLPFTIGLAHRRFAIIDLSANAHQPFFDSDRLCCVVVNGEIFNYLELRNELVKHGHKFRSASDVEVIVEAYKAWGVECFSRFNGMWAVALYDFRSRRLILSRDRLGEIPLYWTRVRDSICFASEIRALWEVASSPSVNEAAIYPYLVHGLQAVDDETFFEGISSFPAATWASLERSFPKTARRYWDAPRMRFTRDEISVREAVRCLRDTLQDAVRIRLRADVPYCVTLSGGLDSSVLVALAAQCSNTKVDAHTIRFAEKQWDEEPFARAVAHHCGAVHRIVDPPLHNFWHETLPFTYLAEEPYHAPNIYSRQLLHRAMRSEGFKVVLVGEGSDELFAGYMRHFYLYQAETLRSNCLAKFLDTSLLWSEADARLKPAFRLLKDHLKRNLLGRFSPQSIPADFAKAKPTDEYVRLPATARADGDLPANLSEVLYQEVTSTSIPYWVRTNDRMRMGIPIEGRSPFLDYRVVELGLRLPVSYLIRHGWQKWILRKAFQDLLPKEIVWRRQKGGFPIPFQRFVLTSPPTIQTLLNKLSNPYVDLALFERFSAERAQHPDEWTAHIDWWRMISFLLWYELFINHNEELFAKIGQEQRENNYYVANEFKPQFLHTSEPSDGYYALQQAYL
jgi:asparagine synthase (glutamine-hydrolysing)